ncbi:glutamate--tRNA ligase [Helicobacter sp. 23-1045]
MTITRFAPSPTGFLHIGGLRTALFNYLYAKKNGGKFLLRIEDTDFSRNSDEAVGAILEAFSWVGLEYDNKEVVFQSKRLEIYRKYAQALVQNGKAYFCYMTKDELDAERQKAQSQNKIYRYDNRYRDFSGTPPKGVAPAIRIKAPLDGEVCFYDALKGKVAISAKEIDDYIIMRSDGTPTYNFVVAVDDAEMGISDVIRGDDHLSNTPKQVIVYDALGFQIPRFCHIPMILNEKGHKLSKRDGAMNVMDYKAMGFLPEALLNFLLRLGFSHNDKEIFSLSEMIELFNLGALSHSPSAYNLSKLHWLNNHYIKECDDSRLERLLGDFLGCEIALDSAKKATLFAEIKPRVETLKDFGAMIDSVLNAPQNYDEKMMKKCDLHHNNLDFGAIIERVDFGSVESISDSLHAYADKSNIKIGKIMMSLRLIMLGQSGGIGVNETLFIIGKDEALRRIHHFKSR